MSTARQLAYDTDLALIHDQGFGHVARGAARTLHAALQHRKSAPGTIVDLGCGSGILSAELAAAGYQIHGVDISPAMLEIARRRVPGGTFLCESVFTTELPPCVAVAAIGEVFNYLFDASNSAARLERLLRRIHRALVPDGVLLMDIASPGRVPAGKARAFAQQDDWACLYEATEAPQTQRLTRHITTFRRRGKHFVRSEEVHHLRLIPIAAMVAALRSLGFRVRRLRYYDDFIFPAGWYGILARKPAT